MATYGLRPVLQEGAVCDLDVQRKRLKSRSPDGVIPTGKEAQELVLADFCDGSEFRARWYAAKTSSDRGDRLQNEAPIDRELQSGFYFGAAQSTNRIVHCSYNC